MDQAGMGSACPRVSIVVPVYAGERSLGRLIQRCENLRDQWNGRCRSLCDELIFVCDEPRDRSQELLERESLHRDWIRVIPLACNRGQHVATAVGILYSSGDWILTMDEDLQHPPELLPDLLVEALSKGSDILYVKSTKRVHAQSIYRDLSSRASKATMRILTRHDYSIVSSFRLVRGEIARSIASSIDVYSYLDASLFSVASARRRRVYHASLTDTRTENRSGYDLMKLIRHYMRFVLSAEPSGLRLLLFLMVLLVLPILVGSVVWLAMALADGVTAEIAPGWLSLFTLGISLHLFMLGYFIYGLKVLSVLLSRSTGMPPFMVLSRLDDAGHLAFLQAAALHFGHGRSGFMDARG